MAMAILNGIAQRRVNSNIIHSNVISLRRAPIIIVILKYYQPIAIRATGVMVMNAIISALCNQYRVANIRKIISAIHTLIKVD